MKRLFDFEYDYDKTPRHTTAGLLYNLGLISYDRFEGANRKIVKMWPGLRFELLMKYQWYFRRIAALHQIEYPQKVFGFEVSRNESKHEQKLREIESLQAKIRNAKGKITQAGNELAQLKAGWKELFPLEQHPKWEQTTKKLVEKQTQLLIMERQLEALTD